MPSITEIAPAGGGSSSRLGIKRVMGDGKEKDDFNFLVETATGTSFVSRNSPIRLRRSHDAALRNDPIHLAYSGCRG